MDIRQLKAFIAVFEERNITAAAARLCITQPTLSVTIRQLEESLGTTLFVRQARGVDVSADARMLYPQACKMVADALALQRQFQRRERVTEITLGIEADIGTTVVAALIRTIRQLLPDILITLEEGCGGDARLTIQEDCCEDELFLPFWEDPFVLALPVDHPLASRATIDQDDLQQGTWVICPNHPSHQRLLSIYGNDPHTAARAATLPLALHLVAAGQGMALLPRQLIESTEGVIVRPVALPLPTLRIGLCYAPQALDNLAVQTLYQYLQPGETSDHFAVRELYPA